MGGYITSNGCFRSRILPNKFINFRSFFLKGFSIRGLGLMILDSVYVARGGVRIVADLRGVRRNQGRGLSFNMIKVIFNGFEKVIYVIMELSMAQFCDFVCLDY
jgi:hypothetical protein